MDLGQFLLEAVQCLCTCHNCGQAVPGRDNTYEQRMSVVFGGGIRSEKTKWVILSGSLMGKLTRMIWWAILSTMHSLNLALRSCRVSHPRISSMLVTLLKLSGCILYIACSTPLDHFQLPDVILLVGVP